MARIALIAMLALTACKTELYTGLSEVEANEIVAILALNGITGSRQVTDGGGVTVFVEEKAFPQAVQALRNEGYPKERHATLGDIFEGDGFVVSQTEERARFIFAMSEELSRTISGIDGVLSARTHVVLPTAAPLARDSMPSSASVVIRHAEAASVEALLPQIKMLVANSIEGLEYRNVSVVFLPVKPRALSAAAPVRTDAVTLDMWMIYGGAAVAMAVSLVGALLARLRRPGGRRRMLRTERME
ncbi:type III secretion system inner membrane ring lipoprotein SctJ [Roseobacter weihaiensis]|uniref:type III secretion system inner membrane ring lipoprotein SctJ n=1 Tax=Roseobacter weihaiensis TaxID=2763262 RepID=UPI001D0B959A|nr:type III secretion inner membrane ring lipoprotein SctJ [Roseobacter sp. H9]